MKRGVLIGLAVLCGGALGLIGWQQVRSDPFSTGQPLRPGTGDRIMLMPPGLSLDPLPPGWAERKFWRVPATDYSLVVQDGVPVLRCATDSGASILGRDTDIPVAGFPTLIWSWNVTRPIESDRDEATRAGDDHPARLFLRFAGPGGERRAAEIIWANRDFAAGEVKIIDGFHHLVAAGPADALNEWHPETVDLSALVRELGGDPATERLRVLGFFCDSDDTGGRTEAFFRDVVLMGG